MNIMLYKIFLMFLIIQTDIKNTIKKRKLSQKKCIALIKDYFYLLCYVFFVILPRFNTYHIMY